MKSGFYKLKSDGAMKKTRNCFFTQKMFEDYTGVFFIEVLTAKQEKKSMFTTQIGWQVEIRIGPNRMQFHTFLEEKHIHLIKEVKLEYFSLSKSNYAAYARSVRNCYEGWRSIATADSATGVEKFIIRKTRKDCVELYSAKAGGFLGFINTKMDRFLDLCESVNPPDVKPRGYHLLTDYAYSRYSDMLMADTASNNSCREVANTARTLNKFEIRRLSEISSELYSVDGVYIGLINRLLPEFIEMCQVVDEKTHMKEKFQETYRITKGAKDELLRHLRGVNYDIYIMIDHAVECVSRLQVLKHDDQIYLVMPDNSRVLWNNFRTCQKYLLPDICFIDYKTRPEPKQEIAEVPCISLHIKSEEDRLAAIKMLQEMKVC